MEWINKKERMPRADETDAQKCVLGWHELFGCMTVNAHELERNLFVTHWMPLPKGPKGEEPTDAPAYRPGIQWQNKK